MQERVRLTRALADKHGKRIADVKDWLPLLRFTQGNPLTITVMVGQALRDGISSAEQIEAYLTKLHNGETAFDDEASEGRSKSLGASLSYGFEQAFSADERKVLALLHFFQEFVEVRVLWQMGNLEMITGEDYSLHELANLQPETFDTILDKAADIGLLTSHGGGYYTIHPALPWFFKNLFEQVYPEETFQPSDDPNRKSSTLAPGASAGVANRKSALRAFVESMGELSNYYSRQYDYGNRDVIAPLRSEEPNLLHARSLARWHGWWNHVISTMQGLQTLYDHTGRRAEWKRLVEEIVPDFVGADDLPLSGREDQWSIVTQHRVLLAKESRDWAEAERLQRVRVDWNRRRAASLLARPAESLSAAKKTTLLNLGSSLHELAEIQRELGLRDCVSSYAEASEIAEKLGDNAHTAIAALNLGHAYMGDEVPTLRNLDEAERWYRRSLELRAEDDKLGHAKCYSQLGLVEYENFKEARSAKQSDENLLAHLNAAVKWYNLALENDPPDMPVDLAIDHNQLGIIYAEAGDLDLSVNHWNNAAKFFESAGDLYHAGVTQRNLAVMLANNGRLPDALLYARAALRNYESYGERAKDMGDKVKGLIADIEEAMKG